MKAYYLKPSWMSCVALVTLLAVTGCKPTTTVVPDLGDPAGSLSTSGETELPVDPMTETTDPLSADPETTVDPVPADPTEVPEPKEDPTTDSPKAEDPATDASKEKPQDQVAAVKPKTEAGGDAKVEDNPLALNVTKVGDRVVSGDWPMWGGTIFRNMVNPTTEIPVDFDLKTKKHIRWTADLGSQTYGNPVIADGKVYVGTNNGAERRPKHKGDRGVVMCFDEKTGKFLWQLTREKLTQGRVSDWPEQGICSAVCVEGKRAWVVTNRCELMCLDTEGFYDDENDGPITDEVDSEKEDADIIWNLDMIEELGVFPHNLATSSPLVYGDVIYILTSNGVDEAHLAVPSPRSPCFLAVNKNTGEIVWEDNRPFDKILHGQWASPAVGIVNGKAQIYMPGGDGWLYAFEPLGEKGKSKLIWKFDLNPKDSKWELGGRGDRNALISTPVFYDNSVILGVGQDPEHGEGVGHLYRIDATKTGDITENGAIWHYGGTDKDDEPLFRRTISTVAVDNGLVFAADLSGFLHCVDFKTGKRYWEADVLAAIWGSPMVVDGKVFLGDEDGDVHIYKASKELKEIFPDGSNPVNLGSSVYSTGSIANGALYFTTRNTLISIGEK